MYTGLGPQPSVGVLAHDMHGRALDARDFARRGFDDFGFETVRLRPSQVHAEHHLAPVLCLRTTGAGLDVEIRIVGVHLTGKHAAKFESGNDLFKLRPRSLTTSRNRRVVILVDGHFEQFAGIGQPGRDLVETCDDLLELRTLLPQRLGALGFVPDVGLFEFALDLGQAFRLALIVKDTSSTHQSALRGRQSFV